jgi:molybdopterin-guanine dinucleotide biosynthesis protein A
MECTICSIMETSAPLNGTALGVPIAFSAGVLAGGRSIRMGADKSFLRVGNELLIERQLRCLRETGPKELLISGRRGVDYSSLGADVIYDQHPDCGPLAGVAALLTASSCPIILILAVDTPAILPVMLNKIVSQCTANSGCVPIDENGFQPLAAAYPKTAHLLAQECLRNRELSVQAFVKQALAEGLVQSLPIEPSERIYFVNWNRPSDWMMGGSG